MTSIGGFLSSTALLSTNTSGALVQVDFIGNQITAGGGNQLFADIDFDGDVDFAIGGTSVINGPSNFMARVDIEGASNKGGVYASTFAPITINVVNGNNGTDNGFVSVNLTGSVLGDHQGFLEISTNDTQGGAAGVYIERFVYDDASATLNVAAIDLNTEYTSVGTTSVNSTTVAAVPEPSSLAMLAAGAGGLMMRRRRKQESA